MHLFITENQFANGLSLAVGKEAQLSRAEIQKVVEFYRTSPGGVRYREFCEMLENAFTVPHLEKKPLKNVPRPAEGALGRVSFLRLVHTGRVSTFACKFAYKPFDLACKLCEHSH